MEWIDALPERLQDAIWYGVLLGAAFVVFVIGYRRAGPLFKMPVDPISAGAVAKIEDEVAHRLDDIIGGLRQVVQAVESLGRILTARVDEHSRREVEELSRVVRELETIAHRMRRD